MAMGLFDAGRADMRAAGRRTSRYLLVLSRTFLRGRFVIYLNSRKQEMFRAGWLRQDGKLIYKARFEEYMPLLPVILTVRLQRSQQTTASWRGNGKQSSYVFPSACTTMISPKH